LPLRVANDGSSAYNAPAMPVTNPSTPVVYIGDDSPSVRAGVSDRLKVEGILVYTPALGGDPERDTASIGALRCALFHLDRSDAIDTAELLRVYQPTLPVAFLHEIAGGPILLRARVLGPLFRSPQDLASAHKWAREHAKR